MYSNEEQKILAIIIERWISKTLIKFKESRQHSRDELNYLQEISNFILGELEDQMRDVV